MGSGGGWDDQGHHWGSGGHSSPAPPTQAESQQVQAAGASGQGLPGQATDQGSRVSPREPELGLRPAGECPRPQTSGPHSAEGLPPASPPPREEDLDLPAHVAAGQREFA